MTDPASDVLKNKDVTITFNCGTELEFVGGANEGLSAFCGDYEKFLNGTAQTAFRYDIGAIGEPMKKTIYLKFSDVVSIFHQEVKGAR